MTFNDHSRQKSVSRTIERPSHVAFPPLARFMALVMEEFSAQRDRLVLWMPVFFGIGISCYFSLRFEPWPVFTGAVTLFLFALTAFIWPLRHSFKSPFYLCWLTSFAFLLLAGGFSAAQYQAARLDTVMLEKETGPSTVTGTVLSVERLEEGQGWRAVLVNPIIEDLSPDKTPRKVRLKIWKGEDLVAGDTVSLLADIMPPGPPVVPRAFDFQRYAYFQGIGGFGFAYTKPEIIKKSQQTPFTGALELMRERIAVVIGRHMNGPEAAVAIALMTGKRAGIAEEDWEALRKSGLAHMLAISGLHVGLITGVIFFFARFVFALFPRFALRHPIKKYAALISFSGALFYTLLVGGTIPTVRALLMVGVVLCGILLDRTAISLRLVALTAMAILMIWPSALWGASFQMSFGAVTALVVFYQALRPYWSQWRRGAGLFRRLNLYFLSVCITTTVATLATAPFALYHFQQLALYGLLANLVAVPIMALGVMPLIVLAYLFMPFKLGWVIFWPIEQGIHVILRTAHDVAGLPESTYLIPALPFSVFICLIAAGLILCLWKGYGRLAFIVPLTWGILLFSYHTPADILVAADGKLMAFRDTQGQLYVSSRRHGRFSADVWQRRSGGAENGHLVWAREGYTKNTGMTCGEWGCHLVKNGKHVAFSFHPASIKEDCEWADILIAQDPVNKYKCAAPVIIDRFDTWRNGSYALWTDRDLKQFEHTAMTRGQRPWTATNSR